MQIDSGSWRATAYMRHAYFEHAWENWSAISGGAIACQAWQ